MGFRVLGIGLVYQQHQSPVSAADPTAVRTFAFKHDAKKHDQSLSNLPSAYLNLQAKTIFSVTTVIS